MNSIIIFRMYHIDSSIKSILSIAGAYYNPIITMHTGQKYGLKTFLEPVDIVKPINGLKYPGIISFLEFPFAKILDESLKQGFSFFLMKEISNALPI